MNKQKIDQIEQQAEQILRDSGAYSVPVPVDRVARHLNLKAQSSPLGDKVSGVLVVENLRGAIAYNSSHAPVRQRFTIAHEKGHNFLHVIQKNTHSRLFIDRYIAHRDEDSSTGNDHEEVEANSFGAALLMPAKLVREEIKRYGLDLDDEEDLSRLAKRFNVSSTAMSYRLGTLGLLR